MNGGIKSVFVLFLCGLLALGYFCFFIVDQRQTALLVRFGKIQRSIDQPGVYFKIPGVDELVLVEKRVLSLETSDMAVQVSDGRRYLVDSVTVLRVSDPSKFRETVGASLDRAFERIKTRLDAALRQTYGRRAFDAALSRDRAQIMVEIRNQVKPEAASLGIDVLDVRIRRTDLMPEVLQDTYDRMRAERFAEAAELRAIGQARAAKIKAEADRQAVELIAQAHKESEILRGEGDQEKSRIFAKAFEKDPDFFSFYRSMKAYLRAFASDNTSFVLAPNSDFFRYFQTPQSSKVPSSER